MARAIVLLLLVTCAFAYRVPLFSTQTKDVINGQYIAVFQPNITQQKIGAHYASLLTLMESAGNEDDNKIIAKYSIEDFQGYAFRASESVLSAIRSLTSEIEFIEADQIVRLSACSQRTNAVWGLDRISESNLNIDGIFRFNASAGTGVDAYIVDTGIYLEHQQFGGRAVWGVNYAGDGKNTDCNGHGTHVAGTVGGSTYGVASNVKLIAVKVLNCEGSGSNSGVISGINYVGNQHTKAKKSVANLSLGGSYSSAVNTAVKNAIAKGVVFVVAAGNDNKDACNYSPASEATAITVGATTLADKNSVQVDARATFSNFGTCVTLFAPGQAITSAWIGSPTAIETISGTSMASPHVAGIAALYLGSTSGTTPAAVKTYLKALATKDKIQLNCASSSCTKSPNLLAYAPCA